MGRPSGTDVVRKPLHGPWRARAAALLALLGALVGAPDGVRADPGAEPGVYSFDIVLAPVSLEGTFPATISLSSGSLTGSLRLDTDLRGRLSGDFTAGGRTLPLTGRVTYTAKKTTASFTARSGKDRIEFSGAVTGQTLNGHSRGKGTLAPGRHAFSADLTSAGPLVAQLDCALTETAKGRLRGTARVTAAGETADLRVSGSNGRKRTSLTLSKGRLFRFAGHAPALEGVLLLDWKARGIGARRSGVDAALESLAPPDALDYVDGMLEFEAELPIDPVGPLVMSAPRATFAVEPALPGGLSIGEKTGVVAGVPSEIRAEQIYTVTATNYAGSISSPLDLKTRISRARSFAPELRTLSDDDFRHFLERTQFGAPAAQLDLVRSKGLDQYITDMMAFSMTGPAEAVAFPELVNDTDPVGLEGMFPGSSQVARWWSSLMVHTDNPFQERLAFFWSDHFAVSVDVLEGGETHFMREYVDLYRREGNGNLRKLLVEMARSPAMLKYLDGYRSTARKPNENFAREFWELFTLGVDNGYTQADIVEGSRAYTGWRFTTDEVTGLVSASFLPSRHDEKEKKVLGVTIPGQALTDDFQAMVDATLDNRPVAEYIVRRLFEHFCYAHPPAELVEEMATSLRDGDYELAPFLRDLFRSEAFFATQSRRVLVKNPVDFGLGFIRATGLEPTVSSLRNQLASLGQVPSQPPTVNGWPQGDMWFSAQNMADRANLVYTCIEDTTRQRSVGIEIAAILPPVEERSAAQVVDAMAALLRVPLTDAERQSCVDYLNSTRLSNGTYSFAVPFDGAIQAHLDERVRGLLYVLAQHPVYQLR